MKKISQKILKIANHANNILFDDVSKQLDSINNLVS